MISNKKAPSQEQLNILLEYYTNKQFVDLEKKALSFTKKFPSHPFGWKALGIALKNNGKISDSLKASKKVLELSPKDVEAHNNLGNTLGELGKLEESKKHLNQAIKLNPNFAPAHNNLGNTFKKLNIFDECIKSYKKAIELEPYYLEAYNNLGVIFKEIGQLEESEKILRKTIKINSKFAPGFNNLAITLQQLGKLKESEKSLQEAIKLNPKFAEAYYNLGNILKELVRLDESIGAFEKCLNLNNNYVSAEVQIYNLKQLINDYSLDHKLKDKSAYFGIKTEPIEPFSLLSWNDNAEHNLQRAKIWSKKNFKEAFKQNFIIPKENPKRLKVGFFSADFNNHPIMYLIKGLFREYDKEKIEIFVYSYGRKKSKKWHQQIDRNVDHFLDVSSFTDKEIISSAKTKNLDIAIDLMGYTSYSRSNIFRFKLAPIQINFLGYAGTTGADYMDYIIADPVLIPNNNKKFFSEKIIYMPHTYLPTDYDRKNDKKLLQRANFKLPEEKFVLCCFNNNYKIREKELDIWMKILRAKKNSVLWLIKSNKWSEKNIYKEAKKRNVEPSRIIFAEKLPHSEHINRHQLADLFIDTFNYNAHMTASDALWGGLPVITKQGQQFSSRVASSLLMACGLSELITNNEEDYENLIIELIEKPEKIHKIKQKLSKNILKEPLFDTKRYTRNFENGLRGAYNNYFKGNITEHIEVTEN